MCYVSKACTQLDLVFRKMYLAALWRKGPGGRGGASGPGEGDCSSYTRGETELVAKGMRDVNTPRLIETEISRTCHLIESEVRRDGTECLTCGTCGRGVLPGVGKRTDWLRLRLGTTTLKFT